jgi:hypothetical protein
VIDISLCKRPNRVGVSLPSPEDGNRSSFRHFVFFIYLESRTMDKVQKPSDSKYIPIVDKYYVVRLQTLVPASLRTQIYHFTLYVLH